MKPPFEKFSVAIDEEYSNQISIFIPSSENPNFSESAEECRKFIEDAIREKMERK